MPRKPFVGGNWKCNGTVSSFTKLVEILNAGDLPGSDVVDMMVAPPYIHIPGVLGSIADKFIVAAQNATVKGGAFTGELSPAMIKDFGLKWVILGHSERRNVFKESNELIGEKVAAALAAGLDVVFCCGEHLHEREANKTEEVVCGQIASILDKVDDWSRIVIAYEPVWAIGTGVVASKEQAEEAHEFIRVFLAEKVAAEIADATRVIYGGSVTAKNCVDLAAQPNIDGFLVGGASLKPEIIDIINAMK